MTGCQSAPYWALVAILVVIAPALGLVVSERVTTVARHPYMKSAVAVLAGIITYSAATIILINALIAHYC